MSAQPSESYPSLRAWRRAFLLMCENPRLLADEITLMGISAELARLRTVNHTSRGILAALTMELGKLAHVLLDSDGCETEADHAHCRELVQRRTIRIAALAARLLEDGDRDFTKYIPPVKA